MCRLYKFMKEMGKIAKFMKEIDKIFGEKKKSLILEPLENSTSHQHCLRVAFTAGENSRSHGP